MHRAESFPTKCLWEGLEATSAVDPSLTHVPSSLQLTVSKGTFQEKQTLKMIDIITKGKSLIIKFHLRKFATDLENQCLFYSLTNLNSVTVHAGTNQLNQQGQSYKVSKIVSHKDYNSIRLVNDVALILVSSNIAFNNLVGPIKLATGSKTYEGSSCVLSGWGTTRVSARYNCFGNDFRI